MNLWIYREQRRGGGGEMVGTVWGWNSDPNLLSYELNINDLDYATSSSSSVAVVV